MTEMLFQYYSVLFLKIVPISVFNQSTSIWSVWQLIQYICDKTNCAANLHDSPSTVSFCEYPADIMN